jgi:hypothetical protein
MSRIRYGRVVHAMVRRGLFHPLLLVLAGRGDEREMGAFVEFYERYLAGAPASAPPHAGSALG